MKGNEKECMAGAINNLLTPILTAISKIQDYSSDDNIKIMEVAKKCIKQISELTRVPIMSDIFPYSGKLQSHDHCSKCGGDLKAKADKYCEGCWEAEQTNLSDMHDEITKLKGAK